MFGNSWNVSCSEREILAALTSWLPSSITSLWILKHLFFTFVWNPYANSLFKVRCMSICPYKFPWQMCAVQNFLVLVRLKNKVSLLINCPYTSVRHAWCLQPLHRSVCAGKSLKVSLFNLTIFLYLKADSLVHPSDLRSMLLCVLKIIYSYKGNSSSWRRIFWE